MFDNVWYGEFNSRSEVVCIPNSHCRISPYQVRHCLHVWHSSALSLSGHISCSILIDELSQKRLLQNQLGNLQVLILILMKQQRKFSKFYLSKDFQIEELGYGCRHWDQFVQRILLKVTQTILAKLIYR